ncbi:hypothetical protein [Aquabacter cavernae]|uniref:hypothetical protein n=1 Tax=Aquabacter cavernae TaxID=2496029 RepID=UPI000F8C3BED|nr:hypothetical protein [Aquabacter cavernae]
MADIDPKIAEMLTPEGFARKVITMHDEVAASLAAAQEAGNKKLAGTFARELRKLDKLIEQRGLKRLAQGA